MAADYTVADLAAVRRAIARGEKRVQFADRTVDYRDISELLDAESRIVSFLQAAAATRVRSKQAYGITSSGF